MISEQFFPLVSIIIPVYNGSDYLAEAVDSALNQTYKNIEVIVINDGSNDDGQTENIALLYGNKIRYIRKENGGVASALNLGISLMKGEYFSWLSHDDLYSNNKISKQIKILASISDKTTILYSGYKLLTPESRERGIFNPKLYYPEDKLNQSLFPLFRGLINGCTLLIHKSHFDRIGYFDESLLSTQDMDLWFKMFRNQNIKYCDNQEVKTRIHDNQGSKTINTHNEECSKLWINMIKSVDTEEMKEMFGSEGAFYNETILFLTKHTDYKAAIDFMKDKVPDYYMYNSVFNKCSLRLILNKIRLLYYKIKYDGLLVTLKKSTKNDIQENYMKKITVIICVYNGENYIEKSLSSVLNQTCKDIEILIVDDGSTDSTLELIKETVKDNKNVDIVINSENRGVGFSRNKALSLVKTKYVGFLDADDYIEDNYYIEMLKSIEENSAQIVLSDISLVYEHRNLRSSVESFDGSLLGYIKQWGIESPCNKLIEKELLIQFPFEEKVCEEIPAIIPSICNSQKIAYCSKVTYYYVQTSESLKSNEVFQESRLLIPEVISLTLSRISNSKDYEKIKEYIVRNFLIFTLIHYISNIKNFEDKFKYLKLFYSKIKHYDISNNIALKEYYESITKFEVLYYEMLIDFLESKNDFELQKLLERKPDNSFSFIPKVSIIIPVYNGADFLEEAIKSALSQSYSNFEVIVVNDGSNDNGDTERIAKKYGDRIKYYYKDNGGVSTALNYGIEVMTGEYFSWLSHDDLYSIDKIQTQMDIINSSKDNKTVVCSGYSVINEHGEWLYNMDPFSIYPEEKLDIGLFSVVRGLINGNCLLIHKSYFDKLGMFDPDLPSTQDYDYWFKLLSIAPFKMIREILVKSRIHENQGSRTLGERHLKECNELWINIFDKITEDSMIEMDGSKYAFYKNSYDFFSNQTPYDDFSRYIFNYYKKEEDILKETVSKFKVSVIIPVFNRIQLALESIESALNQTHKNIEIIIIDDGSTEIIDEVELVVKKHNNVHLYRQSNQGVSAARNYGIEIASGDYVALLDSDDLMEKNKIEEQLREMLIKDYNFSFTAYERISTEGIKRGKVDSLYESDYIYPDVIACCKIATPTVMFKRDFFIKHNFKFETKYSIGEDVCLWIDILSKTKAGYIDKPYTKVRVSENSAANSRLKQREGLINILQHVINDSVHSKNEIEIRTLLSALCIQYDIILKQDNDNLIQEYVVPEYSEYNKVRKFYKKTMYSIKNYGMKITLKKMKNKIVYKLSR